MTQKTLAQQGQYYRFISTLDNLYSTLEPFSQYINLEEIADLKKNFTDKIDDFHSEHRKFNFAVIGQVKAGKSSFLNALFFNGKTIFPLDCTPKTATLTKIEYSPKNALKIEYYTALEWEILKNLSKAPIKTNQTMVAKEIFSEVAKNNLYVEELLEMQTREILFNDYSELADILNDYVSEGGKFTPIVKSVTLKLNIEELKGISIVDTPGLGDPMISRVEKTREFIEKCDAVFFLSRASYFLDQNDISLLTTQLPQKGVKKLILLASKYDSALIDVSDDYDNLEQADQAVKNHLKSRARDSINTVTQNLIHMGCSNQVLDVVKNCKVPYFMSVMSYKMSIKKENEYTNEEKRVQSALNVYGDISSEMMNKISNFEKIKNIYEEIISQKEELLQNKANSLVLHSQSELKIKLKKMQDELEKNTDRIENTLVAEKNENLMQITNKINDCREIISNIFALNFETVESEAHKKILDLYDIWMGFSSASKKGINLKNEAYKVDDSKWFNPFTWNKSHTEYRTIQNEYVYIDTQDLVSVIKFIVESSENIYSELAEIVSESSTVENKIYTALLEKNDFSPGKLRAMTKQAMTKITVPKLVQDFSEDYKFFENKYPTQILEKNLIEQAMSDIQRISNNVIEKINKNISDNVQVILNGIKRAEFFFAQIYLSEMKSKQLDFLNQRRALEQQLSKHQEAQELLQKAL